MSLFRKRVPVPAFEYHYVPPDLPPKITEAVILRDLQPTDAVVLYAERCTEAQAEAVLARSREALGCKVVLIGGGIRVATTRTEEA